MGRRSAGAALLVAGVLAASCGSELQPRAPGTPRIEPIPAGALPGRAAQPKELDAHEVSMDAVDVDELEALLEGAGFVAGTERRYSRTVGGRRMTLARILVFETARGAKAYLGWLEDHVDDVIGNARPVDGLSVPDGTIVFVHQPNPCCHGETRLVLAAWKHGDTVKTLELGGQVVRTSPVPELISSLDRAV
ncbi:MAG TPA: hypothetical protein VFM85_02445 [Actinomycetota bacterium]|nr:hypothetical protein [Actinomycetota bacterium]